MKRTLAILALVVACGRPVLADNGQKPFDSPKAAVTALVAAVKSESSSQVLAILGPDAKPLMTTGDPVAEKNGRKHFLSAYQACHTLVLCSDGSVVLHLGTEQWPFPIPLVKQGSQWHFDTAAGVQDILNRHIGANEINAVKVCEAYVKAQRKYASSDPLGDGISQYAQRIHSTAGQHDGLYWETAPGAALSPMGPLVGQAEAEGYAATKSHGPYQGYHFHVLKRQGEHAAGGAYDYSINGHMVAGFALVAYPEKYGVTGIMTYIVNQNGYVYKKDLGPNTEDTVKAMTDYDPDDTWKRL